MALLTDLLSANTTDIAANATAAASAGSWALLSTLDVTGANSAQFTIDNSYVVYKVIAEDARSTSHFTHFRLKVGNAFISAGLYGYSMWRGYGSSSGYSYVWGTANSWPSSNNPREHMSNYEYTVTGLVAGRKPTVRWHQGGGEGDAGELSIAGGVFNLTDENTGFELSNPYANWTSGKFKLYGLN
jgi:hypothetical protein